MAKNQRKGPPTAIVALYLIVALTTMLIPALPVGAVDLQSSRPQAESRSAARSVGVGSPQITDLSDTEMSIIFTTDDEHSALVRYGTVAANLNLIALDDRDVAAGVSQPTIRSTVHRFTLSGLAPGTPYFYKPIVDGVAQTDPFGQPLQQTTAPRLGMQIPSRVHGTVTSPVNGNPGPGAVLLVGQWINPDGSRSWPISTFNGAPAGNGVGSTYDLVSTPIKADGTGPFTPSANAAFSVAAMGDVQSQLLAGGPLDAVKGANITIVPLLVLAAPPATPTVTNTATATNTVTPTATATQTSTATETSTASPTATQTSPPTATITATSTSTASPTIVRSSPTPRRPSSATPRPTKPAGEKQAPLRCSLSVAVARTTVSRTGSDALFITANPGATLIVHFAERTFPTTATLFTTSTQGAGLKGKGFHKTVDYRFSLPTDGLTLLVFDLPAKASLGRIQATVLTYQACAPASSRKARIAFTVAPRPRQGPEGLGTPSEHGTIELRFSLPASVTVSPHTLPVNGTPVRVVARAKQRTAIWTIVYPVLRSR